MTPDLDAIRARHVRLPGDGTMAPEGTDYCGLDLVSWPCDTAVVLAALEERVTFDEELRRRMDAVRPLRAKLDAAEAREAKLREASVNCSGAPHHHGGCGCLCHASPEAET